MSTYWSFFEATAGGREFRDDRRRIQDEIASVIDDVAEVTVNEIMGSDHEFDQLTRSLLRSQVDALVIPQTTTAPPNRMARLVESLPNVPIVLLAAHEDSSIDDQRFDHRAITRQSATVGVPMLANVLARAGRSFDVILADYQSRLGAERIQAAVRSAGAAGTIRRARLARIGSPLEGYDCVDVSTEALTAATGVTVVDVHPGELLDRYLSVTSQATSSAREVLLDTHKLDAGGNASESMDRSLRAMIALESLVRDYDLDAGALNCHVEELRFHESFGITPCFALGALTTRGIPWTCTGDVITAMAMLTVSALGGGTLYHEVEALDYETGEFVLANTGEHDARMLEVDGRTALSQNPWFVESDPQSGICVVAPIRRGAATLVGFTPQPESRGGFKFVVAEGEITGRQFPNTGTVNGSFRFDSSPPEGAWEAWCRAGVTHHSCCTNGHVAHLVKSVADHLDVSAILI